MREPVLALVENNIICLSLGLELNDRRVPPKQGRGRTFYREEQAQLSQDAAEPGSTFGKQVASSAFFRLSRAFGPLPGATTPVQPLKL